MRLILAPAIAAVVLAAAAPAAAATNLVTNGSFEAGYVQNTEFGASYPAGAGPVGWTSADAGAYNLYFDPATASSVDAASRFGGRQKFHTSFSGASPDGGKFVALDGDTNYNGPLTQSIAGLTVGKKYAVSFFWGAGQFDNRTGDTTERLDVSFGGTTQSTATLSNPSGGFTGWFAKTLDFTATASTQTLSFLSIGSPAGLPPLAVLDGVSVTAVPEPATWGLMFAGFGLVGVAVRARRQTIAA